MKLLTIAFSLLLCQITQAKTLTEQLEELKAKSAKRVSPEIKNDLDKATRQLQESGILEKARKIAVKAPHFQLKNRPFKTFYSKKPIILKFYRGSWCPYCQLELKDYQKYKKDFEDLGYQVIILTPDSKKNIQKFKDKNNISFSIYQDKENKIAKKFGIAFLLSPEIIKRYKSFGIDLEKAQGNNKNELPMPGTYVIEKDGQISYSFIDVDYKKRLDPLDLLEVLKKKD